MISTKKGTISTRFYWWTCRNRKIVQDKPLQLRLFDLILGFWQFFFIFWLLIWMVAQTLIRHVIFWQTAIKTFRSIYVNCFNTLRFPAEVRTKLLKMHFLDNLRAITQEGSTETRQMTHFLSTFLTLTVCNIHFYIWKWSKFIFLWSPLWSILVCKIPQFWAKATDLDSPGRGHYTFLESKQLEVTKIQIMFCPARGAKKK